MAKKKQQVEQQTPVEEPQQPTIGKMLEEKLAECEDECKALKKQIAGLRGENTKLKNILDAKATEMNGLYQEVRDLNEKIDEQDEEIYRLEQLANKKPWYKRLFKNKK